MIYLEEVLANITKYLLIIGKDTSAMIDREDTDLELKITITTIIATWMKMQNMNFILKVYCLIKHRVIYMDKIMELKNKNKKEDSTSIFQILIIITLWKAVEEFAVISLAMEFNHLHYLVNFLIKINQKDKIKISIKILRDNYKYYQ